MVDTGFRINQRFYKRMLAKSFPKLFSDLCASGKRPTAVSSSQKKTKMHVDMDHMLCVDEEFRTFCTENSMELHKRDAVPWLDLPAILDRARLDATGLGRPLFGLASAEINLKTGHLGKEESRAMNLAIIEEKW